MVHHKCLPFKSNAKLYSALSLRKLSSIHILYNYFTWTFLHKNHKKKCYQMFHFQQQNGTQYYNILAKYMKNYIFFNYEYNCPLGVMEYNEFLRAYIVAKRHPHKVYFVPAASPLAVNCKIHYNTLNLMSNLVLTVIYLPKY